MSQLTRLATENCDIGWVAAAIKEMRLTWQVVYATNHIIGYIMLFACFFLVWYYLHTRGSRAEEARTDERIKPPKKRSKDK